MTLINPHTKKTFDEEALLSALMEWTTEQHILSAMIRAGRADEPGIVAFCNLVRATAEKAPEVKTMDARAVARSVMSFLVDAEVRNVVARYVSTAHGIRYDQVKQDLYELREYLKGEFRIEPNDVPRFTMSVEPDWLEEYRNSTDDLNDEGVEFIQEQTPAVQQIIRLFPPMCIITPVRDDINEFQQGQLGIVQRVSPEGVLGISLEFGDDEPVFACAPEWVRVVAYCGRITPDRIQEVIDGRELITED